jgi:AcrR family transcriptional regulator
MTVKGRRQEYKELTRAAVLEAARQQFARQGFAATSVDDIAAQARVSKGAVYYHFADKGQLFEAVFRDAQEQLLLKVAAAAAAGTDPWAQLDAGLDAYLKGAVADSTHRTLLREAPGALGPERCREIDEQLAIPLLLATLKSLEATGELAPEPSEMLARLLFSALCEAAMAAGAAANPSRARREAASALSAITAGLRTADRRAARRSG